MIVWLRLALVSFVRSGARSTQLGSRSWESSTPPRPVLPCTSAQAYDYCFERGYAMVPYNDPIIGGESCMLLHLPMAHSALFDTQSSSSMLCNTVTRLSERQYLSLDRPIGRSSTPPQLLSAGILRVALTVSRALPPAVHPIPQSPCRTCAWETPPTAMAAGWAARE